MNKIYYGFLLLWSGCAYDAVSRESFFTDFAEAQCLSLQKCHRARFDGQYKTMDTCMDEIGEDAVGDYETLFVDCTFLQDQAQNCIDLMLAATCAEQWDDEQEIYNACHEDVWDCPVAQ